MHCERSLASHAVYMLIQCTPFYWWKRQDVTQRGESEESVVLFRRGSTQEEGIHPGFETQGRCRPEVQNRGISGPTKRTCVLQKLKKNLRFDRH